MKKLILLTLVTLVGCGGHSGSASLPQQSSESYSSRRCGYENSLSEPSCLAETDYFITSSKALPKKLRLSLSVAGGNFFEYINECVPGKINNIERGAAYGRILIVGLRGLFYDETSIEIENCENSTMFYEGKMKPEVKTSSTDRDKAYFILNN